jgi:prepilin-type N-terminal cleavage/methylation domain-containing protein
LERKGFTLIELLVVIVIIGILVAIALPNFIKIKDKAKEAEVKQNLHAIQLAIERYATDMDGNYPFFLFGGEGLFNIGTINRYNPGSRNGAFAWDRQIHLPFDMFWLTTNTWDYQDTDWAHIVDGDVASAFGDTASYEGYLPKYPTNPFQVNRKAITFSLAGLNITSKAGAYGNWSCYGGKDGRKMWDLGEGWGELPQIVEFPDSSESIDQDLPGNFCYHPRWGDGVTNFEHGMCQAYYNDQSWMADYFGELREFVGSPGDPSDDEINSLDVAGYDLIAIGSPRTKGQDLDNSLAWFGSPNYFRTGYLTLAQERNPYVGPDGPEGDYNGSAEDNYDERPYSDSVPDFYIIHLGSGMDKKVHNPMEDI